MDVSASAQYRPRMTRIEVGNRGPNLTASPSPRHPEPPGHKSPEVEWDIKEPRECGTARGYFWARAFDFTGVAIGGGAIEALHAQAKPPAYVIVAVRSIKDAEAFKTSVVDKTSPAMLAQAGGHYIIRTQNIKSLDGPAPQRFAVLAFDSAEKAQAWTELPVTKEVSAARIKTTDSLSFVVEGFAD
jgi:uncharacterized protein (DUF1330 family)